MKIAITKILVLITSLFYGGIICAQSDSSNTVVIYNECLDVEEFDATFEGGSDQFRNWIYDELLKIEISPEHEKLIATVVFVVNTDGSISDVEIIAINHPEITEQLTTIIMLSPNWNPKGISVNGAAKYYRQRFKLPVIIEFK